MGLTESNSQYLLTKEVFPEKQWKMLKITDVVLVGGVCVVVVVVVIDANVIVDVVVERKIDAFASEVNQKNVKNDFQR